MKWFRRDFYQKLKRWDMGDRKPPIVFKSEPPRPQPDYLTTQSKYVKGRVTLARTKFERES